MWNAKLVSVLRDLGFVQSKFDYSLFTKINEQVTMFLLVYVDDIVITGNSIKAIEHVKLALKTKFKIKTWVNSCIF
jgi:hypothetical protein